MSTPAFSPIAAARHLLRTARTGALATLDAGMGTPFASLVTLATAPDGAPLMLLSTLAMHTRNILQDPRASILIDDRAVAAGADDPLAGARVTLIGRAERLPAEAHATARRRFLARHPEAEGYAGFRDFGFFQLRLELAHLVAGFGRINTIGAADLLLDLSDAGPLIEAESEIIAHLNDDHADTLALYATRLLAQPDGDWRAIGCDPQGLDMRATIEGRPIDARLDFPQAIRASGPLRAILKELAVQAGKVEIVKSI